MAQRVLICDDEPVMRQMLADCLRSEEWEIVGQAGSGRQAIELYRRLRPDVVIMDVVMPDVDGFDALERILELDPQAKIVIVSALSSSRLVTEAARKGAQDFIAKPFVVEHLRDTLRACETTPASP